MNNTRIGGLGEIALRVNDMTAMRTFYRDVVGLAILGDPTEEMTFFKIAEGYAGHTQILALFHRDRARNAGQQVNAPVAQAGSALHHIAFAIAVADYEAEKARLMGLGLNVAETTHAWVSWRSLYVTDPEGNTVEWVCHDASIT